MDKKLRVAVVGMGNMGRRHSDDMIKFEDTELAAVCDVNIKAAEKYRDEHDPDCAVYDDYEKMLDEVKPDAVYVCLPPFAHHDEVELAAERKIAVFIEKPIAMTVEKGQSMVEAVRKNQVVSQVGYQMRFGAAVRRFKELQQSGEAGRMTLFSASYECNSLHSPWWREKDKCGGQVFEQVIHLYDMAQYLMGPAAEVSGRVANLLHQDVPKYTVEDTSICNILFKDGTLGCITGSNCAVKNQWNARFRIVCENLTADFTDQDHATFTYTNKHEGNVEVISGKEDPTDIEDRAFVDAVRGKRAPSATIEEGLSDLVLVASVVKSSENNGSIVKL
jgi:predicted dehydrogenase